MKMNEVFKSALDVADQVKKNIFEDKKVNIAVGSAMTVGGLATYFAGMAMHDAGVMISGLGVGGAGEIVIAAGIEHRNKKPPVTVPAPTNDKN